MSDLQAELESLRSENARLRKLLKLTDAEAAPARGTQTAWFDRAPGQVHARSSSRAKVEFYAALFGARRDVYAVRWENARTNKSGWMPAVEGGWRKGRPASEVRHLPLTPEVLAAHLTGDVHVGLYPMLAGDQTCWLAADFDGQAAMLDALAYLKAARAVGAPAALEVSRSGIGAHVWVFFTDPVPAATARQLGTALIREAIAIRGRMDLRCYDRLFPSQDVLPGQGPGNLIAAPLHGKSRKLGTTVFLDLATLEPFEDQWEYLSTLERLTPKQVTKLASALREPTVGARVERAQPARSTKTQPNPAPIVHLSLDGTVRIPGSELSPSLYATLKHAASTYNPEFYDRQRRRQSTWNIPRIITSYDETLDDHLVLPRGLRDTATRLIEGAGSKVEVDDQRVTGDRLDLTPTFDLRPQQQEAVGAVLPHELALLVAPPGSGKTVMACAVIAQRTVSTLVLVDRKTLADQWRREITDLLGIKPGQLGGGRSTLNGLVDIATLQTLARRTDLADKLSAYGQVVVDECHHVPAAMRARTICAYVSASGRGSAVPSRTMNPRPLDRACDEITPNSSTSVGATRPEEELLKDVLSTPHLDGELRMPGLVLQQLSVLGRIVDDENPLAHLGRDRPTREGLSKVPTHLFEGHVKLEVGNGAITGEHDLAGDASSRRSQGRRDCRVLRFLGSQSNGSTA